MKREGLERDRNGGRAEQTEGGDGEEKKTDRSDEGKKLCSIVAT